MRNRSLGTFVAIALVACGGSPKPRPAPPASVPAAEAPVEQAEPAPPPPPPLPAIPSTPVAAPDGVIATASGPAPASLLPVLARYVDQVEPGAGAQVTLAALIEAAAKDDVDLRGADLTRPLRVIVLDPARYAQPLVVVVGVADERALAAQLAHGDLRYQVRGGWAAIGPFDALAAAGGYALTTLVAQPVPAVPTVDLDVAYVMNRFGGALEPLLGAAAAEMPPEQRELGGRIMRGFLSFLRQIDRVQVSLELSADRITGVVRVIPHPGGGLAAFIDAQHPASFVQLDRLPAGLMSFGGHVDLGSLMTELVSSMEPLMAKLYGAATPDVMKSLRRWGAMKLGELGGVMEQRAGVFGVSLLMDAPDPGLLATLWAEQIALQVKASGDRFTARAKTITYKGTKLAQLTTTPGKAMTAEERAGLAVFGGTPSISVFGLVGKTALFTMGASAPATAKTLSDRLRAGRPAASSPASTLAAAVAEARRRGESLLVAFDLPAFRRATEAMAASRAAAIAGSPPPPPPSPSSPELIAGGEPAALAFGNDGGALAIRLTVPAAQVAGMMATERAAAAASAGEIDAAITAMSALSDRLCSCRDLACAQQVMDAMAAMTEPAGKPTEEQLDRARAIATRFAGCMQQLQSGGAPTP